MSQETHAEKQKRQEHEAAERAKGPRPGLHQDEPRAVPQDPKQPMPTDPSPRSFEGTVKDQNVTEPESGEYTQEEYLRGHSGNTLLSDPRPSGAPVPQVPPGTSPPPPVGGPKSIEYPVQRHPVTGEPELHPNPMLGSNPNPFAPVSLSNRLQSVITEIEIRPASPAHTKAVEALKAALADLKAEGETVEVRGPNPPLKEIR